MNELERVAYAMLKASVHPDNVPPWTALNDKLRDKWLRIATAGLRMHFKLALDADAAVTFTPKDLAANLASLNEIVSALFSGLALGETVDEAYANLVWQKLREHSWQLGFAFNEERPTAEWLTKRLEEDRNGG